MTQTPFELRFNYYMAARDQLQNEYHCKFTEAQYMQEAGIADVLFPKYPSAEEVFNLAETIKAFAEKK